MGQPCHGHQAQRLDIQLGDRGPREDVELPGIYVEWVVGIVMLGREDGQYVHVSFVRPFVNKSSGNIAPRATAKTGEPDL